MHKVYLIRHAEPKREGDDATEWVLSENGEEQVEQLARQSFWDEIKLIVSSPEKKALATVHSIALERRMPLLIRDELRELKRTSERIDDYEARVLEVFEKPALSIGGWERAADAQARIIACFEELVQAHGESPFAIVSHGMVLSLLLATLENAVGYAFDIWQSLGFASVTVAER
jgi:broad specificity phosphatase PhoE